MSLANGDPDTAGEFKYLVYGISDGFNEHGKREVIGVSGQLPTRDDVLKMVNSACDPELHNLMLAVVPYDDKQVLVITIPPTRSVFETTKDLKTPGKNGKTKIYSQYTIFKRLGDQVLAASLSEVDSLRLAKQKYYERAITPPTKLMSRIVGAFIGYVAGLAWSRDFFEPTEAEVYWRIVFTLAFMLLTFWAGGQMGGLISLLYEVVFERKRIPWKYKLVMGMVLTLMVVGTIYATIYELRQ